MAYLAIYFEVWLISYCFFLQVWDANVLTKPVENFNLSRKIYCHHISPLNPTRVAVATDSNHIRLVDLRSGSSSHELRSHTGNVITVKWAPHGSSILASGMYCIIYYLLCKIYSYNNEYSSASVIRSQIIVMKYKRDF